MENTTQAKKKILNYLNTKGYRIIQDTVTSNFGVESHYIRISRAYGVKNYVTRINYSEQQEIIKLGAKYCNETEVFIN